jgi:hypothetical protein
MSFPAKYEGLCLTCYLRIEVGQPVEYVDDELHHAGCLHGESDSSPCLLCNLIHQGACF